MSKTSIDKTYIPYSTVVLSINPDDKLVLSFNTRKESDDNSVACLKKITIECLTEGIDDLTDIEFTWKTCSAEYDLSFDDQISYTLVPDAPPITDIEIELDASIVSNKNYFYLYGIIGTGEDATTILLASGVVYVEL